MRPKTTMRDQNTMIVGFIQLEKPSPPGVRVRACCPALDLAGRTTSLFLRSCRVLCQ